MSNWRCWGQRGVLDLSAERGTGETEKKRQRWCSVGLWAAHVQRDAGCVKSRSAHGGGGVFVFVLVAGGSVCGNARGNVKLFSMGGGNSKFRFFWRAWGDSLWILGRAEAQAQNKRKFQIY